MPTLTKYVEKRHTQSGDEVYSFRVNQYFRDQLAKVPDGTWVKLGPSQYGEHGFALYWQEKKQEFELEPELPEY